MINKKEFEKILQEIFQYFDKDTKVEVVEAKEEARPATPGGLPGGRGDSWMVNIESKESGRLIGKYGETLNEIQYLVRLMAAKLAGERFAVAVDVGGYKAAKNRELEELAMHVGENVKNSGYPQTLRPMNAYERRIVHVVLKDFPGIESISTGEEPYRCVEVKPKGK